jgi:hypothetical protein
LLLATLFGQAAQVGGELIEVGSQHRRFTSARRGRHVGVPSDGDVHAVYLRGDDRGVATVCLGLVSVQARGQSCSRGGEFGGAVHSRSYRGKFGNSPVEFRHALTSNRPVLPSQWACAWPSYRKVVTRRGPAQ